MRRPTAGMVISTIVLCLIGFKAFAVAWRAPAPTVIGHGLLVQGAGMMLSGALILFRRIQAVYVYYGSLILVFLMTLLYFDGYAAVFRIAGAVVLGLILLRRGVRAELE